MVHRNAYTIPLPDGRPLALGRRTLVMGILNVTPDSFAESAATIDPDEAVERGRQMVADGADIIDVGGESTRPGADAVSEEEECRRVLPVIERLTRTVSVPISIDTYKASVADRALRKGAVIVNDISGLRYDADLGRTVAGHRAAIVLMHTRGRSKNMYTEARYEDVAAEVKAELAASLEAAAAARIQFERIVLDPGLGFAKRAEHSLRALALLDRFASFDRPLLVGPSRKSFLSHAIGDRPAVERDWATAGAIAACVLLGAHIVRVHNVAAMRDVVRAVDAILNAQLE